MTSFKTRHHIKTPYITRSVRMGLEYFVVLFSLFSGSTQGKQVTGFPAISVTEFPETTITEFSETSVTEFPETTITDVSETSITKFPETTIIGFPVKTVTGIPDTTVTGLAETSVNGFHETTVTGFPQTKVTGFTESSVNGFPETAVTGFPETTVTVFSESSLTSFPETTVTGSSETTVTWIDAALHCYDHHTILENNITILTDYINASNSVESVWVGSFTAWLPWIEMRGCYNISVDMNTVTDIPDANDPALCQVKCTKTWRTSSRYFGFNQHDQRCVCFEHERLVSKSSEKSSLCSNCTAYNACHIFVDVYKVVNETCDEDQTNEDKFCLARNCSTETPNYSKSKCDRYFKAYCRNKMEAYSGSMTFQTLVANCNVRHSTYPLLRSDIICNNAKQEDTTVMYWVGVYRQKLYLTSLDKLDLTDFQNTQSSIRKFAYLSHFNNHTVFGNRSTKFSFVCKPVYKLSTTDYISTVSTFVNSDLTDESTSASTTILTADTENIVIATEERISLLIIGVAVSITVAMIIIVVILILVLRKINQRNQPTSSTMDKGERTSKLNHYTPENILEGHYHDFETSNENYCLAKPVPDNMDKIEGYADDESTYTRTVSGVYDQLNQMNNRKILTKTPNQNAFEIEGIEMEVFTMTSNLPIDQHIEIDILDNSMSSDYCLAKPIADTDKSDNSIEKKNYIALDNVTKDENVKAYDHWQITKEVDTDPTYDHSKNILWRANHSTYDHCSIKS